MDDFGLFRAFAEGRPYFGPKYACAQGRPERHAYFRGLVEHLDARLPPGPLKILEIGSWAGGSAITWAKAVEKTGRSGTVYCVDSWQPYFDLEVDRDAVYAEMNAGAANGAIIRIFHHNLRACDVNDRVVAIKGRSEDVLPLLEKHTFDVLFIDGSHRYDDVVRDIQLSRRLLKEDGVLCGDDFEVHWRDCDAAALDALVATGVDYATSGGGPFHPGVTAAVRDTLGLVSAFDGVWMARISKGRPHVVALQPRERAIPSHLAAQQPVAVSLHLSESGSFNIVHIGTSFVAVSRSLGAIDLMNEPVGVREFPPLLLVDEDESRLQSRLAEIEKATNRPTFEVIEQRDIHLLVRGGDKVYAVARSLGPVDLLLERLGERECGDTLLIDESEERIRARVAEIERARYRPTFEAIEELGTYVLVRGGMKFYAVARQLGRVDLLQERLGDRELLDVLLIDEDEQRLRKRIAAIEAQHSLLEG